MDDLKKKKGNDILVDTKLGETWIEQENRMDDGIVIEQLRDYMRKFYAMQIEKQKSQEKKKV